MSSQQNKPVPVKNKAPAATQITVEQIMREAQTLVQPAFKPPELKLTDPEELAEYRQSKRKEFEDNVRRVGRWNAGVWVKYAAWEVSQNDFRRARSVWERALEMDVRNVNFWVKYAEMEMKGRFVNHARNVWDRAVTLLPRVDQLWQKYIHMEEMLGNVAGARQVYQRWMQWEPDHHGWNAYINMELRYGEVDKARGVYEQYIRCIPTVKSYVRYAKFEMKNGNPNLARRVYERALEELSEDDVRAELYIKFAEFEEMLGEGERAAAIYKFAMESFEGEEASLAQRQYLAFQKQRGDRDGIEDAIFAKRREEYEAGLKEDPRNYDLWFDLTRLEEEEVQAALERSYHGKGVVDYAKVRNAYEMAVAAVPPVAEKRFWQRYIYLWIKYALFEELVAGDVERTREVYRMCLKLIPHASFTFAKMWVFAAQFEVRQRRLDAARKIFGMAIGMCPKDKLFRSYIEMELSLGNIDRCRTLYEKFLEFNPVSAAAWGQWAELETALGETERARALYEIAISQDELDMPEAMWKAYIDFEIAEGSRVNARGLYERLLEKTQHVKVWMSYAKMECTPLKVLAAEQEGEDPAVIDEMRQEDIIELDESIPDKTIRQVDRTAKAREVYSRGLQSLRKLQVDAKEEAVMLLEAWRKFERESLRDGSGSKEALEDVEKKMPKKVKRKRPILLDDGTDTGGMEEYYDYVFPDEKAAAPNLKILEAAHRWKKQKLEAEN